MHEMSAPTGDSGPGVLEFLRRSMGIEDRWLTQDVRGFSWWAHRLKQRIWAEAPKLDDEFVLVRIHIGTALLRNVPSDGVMRRLNALNRMSALSALVWDAKTSRVFYRSAMVVYLDNAPWASRMLLASAGLQVSEAHRIVESAAKLLGGEPDLSEHPTTGTRASGDELLSLSRLYASQGQKRAPFGKKVARDLQKLKPMPWLQATVDGTKLTAELGAPVAALASVGENNTDLLQVDADAEHPTFGRGVLFTLSIKTPKQLTPGPELASGLNAAEIYEWTNNHLIGAWSYDERLGPTYALFIPGILSSLGPVLLQNMVMSMALRSRWSRSFLTNRADDM